MDDDLLRDYQASTDWSSLEQDDKEKRLWRKLALAGFLLAAGVGMLTGGLWLYFMAPKSDAATALIILGSICFIPGFYHVRIAYKTWKKVPGFTLDAIPDI